MRLGVISDTHGRLPIAVFDHFDGVVRILHAGDIGTQDILISLEAIAPVTAVWGNTDGMELRHSLPEVATLDVSGHRIVVVHGHQFGTPTPRLLRAAHPEADVVVYGHTHRPDTTSLDGRLFVNPGGAGAPRFRLPPSIGILHVEEAEVRFRLISF
ncbi:MAG: metallophosphatase family protein [Gemmatimonadetes bacterium]|nr:metallophosphatase family protein [Gemmatimonadota bacterium]